MGSNASVTRRRRPTGSLVHHRPDEDMLLGVRQRTGDIAQSYRTREIYRLANRVVNRASHHFC